MDPVTHAITGAAIAVTLRRRRLSAPGKPDLIALLAGVAGSLAPDLDFLHDPFDSPATEGLAYMLFHRGYTHTLIGCAALALIAAGLLSLLPRRVRPSFGDLLLIAGLGAGLHLAMDGMNDYGVHPFYPLWNGWLYGDFVFLVEPLVTATLLPLALRPFFWDSGKRKVNLTLAGIAVLSVLAIVGLVWYRVFQGVWVTTPAATLATVWLLGFIVLQLRWPRPAVAWIALAAVVLMLFGMSRVVRAEATRVLKDSARDEELVDVITTPALSNPFCWRVISSSLHPTAAEVVVRLGTFSLLPAFAPPRSCYPENRRDLPSVTLDAADFTSTRRQYWFGRFVGDLRSFDEFAAANCRVRAAEHFLRAPFWSRERDGRVLLGDLRFDYSKDVDTYCKYRFRPHFGEGCAFCPVPWSPPFFPDARRAVVR